MNKKEAHAFLLFGLKHFHIEIIGFDDTNIRLEKGYEIEIENAKLFRLSQNNEVVAPFSDVEELCRFIQMDMAQS